MAWILWRICAIGCFWYIFSFIHNLKRTNFIIRFKLQFKGYNHNNLTAWYWQKIFVFVLWELNFEPEYLYLDLDTTVRGHSNNMLKKLFKSSCRIIWCTAFSKSLPYVQKLTLNLLYFIIKKVALNTASLFKSDYLQTY